jgi:hypothetical protein
MRMRRVSIPCAGAVLRDIMRQIDGSGNYVFQSPAQGRSFVTVYNEDNTDGQGAVLRDGSASWFSFQSPAQGRSFVTIQVVQLTGQAKRFNPLRRGGPS